MLQSATDAQFLALGAAKLARYTVPIWQIS